MSLAEAIQAQIAWQAAPAVTYRTRQGAPTEKGRRYAEAFRASEAWMRKQPRTYDEIANYVGANLGKNPDSSTIRRWVAQNKIKIRAVIPAKHRVISDELLARLSQIPSPDERLKIIREVTGDPAYTWARVKDILKSRLAYRKRKADRMSK